MCVGLSYTSISKSPIIGDNFSAFWVKLQSAETEGATRMSYETSFPLKTLCPDEVTTFRKSGMRMIPSALFIPETLCTAGATQE